MKGHSDNNLIATNGKLFIAGDQTTSMLKAIKRGGAKGVTYDRLESKTNVDRKTMYVYINRLKKNGLVTVTQASDNARHVVIALKDKAMEFHRVNRIN